MIAYFYQLCIRMLFGSDSISCFTDDMDYFATDRPYNRYTNILEHYHKDSTIIDSIVNYAMNAYKNDNMEVCLIDNQYMPLITVPRQHLYYTIGTILLNPLQTIGFSFEITEDSNIKDNTLTKALYMLMLKVLQARVINYAIDGVINDICADDRQTLKDDIAIFIHRMIFDDNALEFERIIDHTVIPQLYSIYDSCTLHLFEDSHPVITNGKIHTDINLSGCFTDNSVSELHSDLLTVFNKSCANELHATVVIKDEDDYEYIKLLTDNTIKISINIVYHKTQDFKGACIEHFVNKLPNKFIKDIIYLHDDEYGLVNDIYDFPSHPPESFYEISERITPFLMDIAKTP